MKKRTLSPEAREQALLAVIQALIKGDIDEGQALRRLRRDTLGLSQQAYADLVGISRRTLSDLEQGKGNVSLAVMNRVFRPLGLRVGLLPRQPALLEKALALTNSIS
ncbi:helix-turn-helix domain-containing protein [Billgrantia diversa]|uniref:helix-turn-helix transcriptional regulator n=1 Tax=Halomonas sp. MCCC 1A13316 TaxID=2733487 RepID=UPI0018A533FC|nr:helix-turn-helix domain-containing protein [Halomonas sp. MCCC 1A13316]QOR39014.1 helix-turn-helix domain-containing protein [Halomonas sp. MCCC 1A13316]